MYSQTLVSFQKYMPPPLPYFKVIIYPFPLPHFASIFSPYLWSFRWLNYIVTLPRYFSFRLPHLNIATGPPSDELDKNSQQKWLSENLSHWNGYSHFRFAQGVPPSLKLETIWFFGVKSWFFTRNTPNIFAPPSARRNFFKFAPPPNLKSWIHPCYRAPLRRIEQE
jgi:hypothetical protein